MASFLDGHGGYCACTRDKCTDDCATYRRFKPKPVTNYDSIISKTPEELAKEFVVLSDRCPDGVDCEIVPPGRECFECWLDWLKQSADKKETEV